MIDVEFSGGPFDGERRTVAVALETLTRRDLVSVPGRSIDWRYQRTERRNRLGHLVYELAPVAIGCETWLELWGAA